MKLDYETLIERKNESRQKREGKAELRLDKQLDAANRMIGELGSGTCYIFPVGGKYREGKRHELVSFLIRNRYV